MVATTLRTGQAGSINIPGPLEVAVEDYTIWHLSRVSTGNFKDNIRKAHDIALENCLDLKQILGDEDPNFFLKHGVKIGAARRFVSNIPLWIEYHKRKRTTEDEDISD
ncbi:hypothetical protein FQN50_009342 [Emmonsiellopsis sp. PD_5]|nr:hypothetical protein FQN50_009342 [Emmonsiellopsis sp. PD_5]